MWSFPSAMLTGPWSSTRSRRSSRSCAAEAGTRAGPTALQPHARRGAAHRGRSRLSAPRRDAAGVATRRRGGGPRAGAFGSRDGDTGAGGHAGEHAADHPPAALPRRPPPGSSGAAHRAQPRGQRSRATRRRRPRSALLSRSRPRRGCRPASARTSQSPSAKFREMMRVARRTGRRGASTRGAWSCEGQSRAYHEERRRPLAVAVAARATKSGKRAGPRTPVVPRSTRRAPRRGLNLSRSRAFG